MFFQKPSLQKLATDAKFELINARRGVNLTQAEVAVILQVPPKTYEAWEHTDNERQPPAVLLAGLPPGMATHWIQFFAQQLNGVFVLLPDKTKLDGSTDDELLQLDVVQGKYIELRKSDPDRALKYLFELRNLVERMMIEHKQGLDR